MQLDWKTVPQHFDTLALVTCALGLISGVLFVSADTTRNGADVFPVVCWGNGCYEENRHLHNNPRNEHVVGSRAVKAPPSGTEGHWHHRPWVTLFSSKMFSQTQGYQSVIRTSDLFLAGCVLEVVLGPHQETAFGASLAFWKLFDLWTSIVKSLFSLKLKHITNSSTSIS